MRTRFGALAGTLLIALVGPVLLAGCAPTPPFPPLAVQLTGTWPTIRYVACKPARVKLARVVQPGPGRHVPDGTERVLWQVSFAPPARLSALPVGVEPPAGGVTDTALSRPLDAATRYLVVLELDDGTAPHQGFTLDKLASGKVSYADGYVYAHQFTSLTRCPH